MAPTPSSTSAFPAVFMSRASCNGATARSRAPVPPFLPVTMFAILFGLSMDYEVFLLSRIREAFLGQAQAGDGVARTAKVITAAAAIMVVFGAFVLSSDLNLKLVGVGLASAILIDATIVR